MDRDPDTIEPAAAAAERVSFQLTYGRSPVQRRFSPGELTGPPIPCAYGNPLDASGGWTDSSADTPASQDGGWYDSRDWPDPDDPACRSEQQWVDVFAGYAVNEAVHEALEWFRVDGRPWLDPHGTPADEDEITGAVDELVARLAAIRARREGARAVG